MTTSTSGSSDPYLTKNILCVARALEAPILTLSDVEHVRGVCGLDANYQVDAVIAEFSDFTLWQDGGPVFEGVDACVEFSSMQSILDNAGNSWRWGWRLHQERVVGAEPDGVFEV